MVCTASALRASARAVGLRERHRRQGQPILLGIGLRNLFRIGLRTAGQSIFRHAFAGHVLKNNTVRRAGISMAQFYTTRV